MTRSLGQRCLRRVGMCVLWATLLTGGAAQAAPDANDAITHLLRDKGLLDAPMSAPPQEPTSTAQQQPSFVEQMRTRASDVASDLVLSAMHFLGVPYKRGGQSEETGFDCSGFTRHIFEMSLGLVLPRRSEEQARSSSLLPIKRDELKPGDLVFFNTMRRTFSHVGIYVGDNKFIHSPRSGSEVRVEDMRMAYWTKRYNGARRAPTATELATPASPAPALESTRPSAPPAPSTAATTAPAAGGYTQPAAMPGGLGAARPSTAPAPTL